MTGGTVFLIDLEDSYGERELAMRFAERLADPSSATFVVPPKIEPYLRDRFAVRTYVALDEGAAVLRELDPALVVCAEFYNLPDPLQAHVVAGPWRVATTDGTTMGVEINSNPFQTPVPIRRLTIPDGLVRLASCPIHDPRPDTDEVYHWEMWPGIARGDREAVRRAWGIEAERVVMTTMSLWSLGGAVLSKQQGHYDLLFQRLVGALQRTGREIEVIVVTKMKPRRVKHGRVTVRFVDYMLAGAFEQLLLGCDLFVGDSVIQMSAAKAYIAGVPTLILVNSRLELGPAYNIFPLALKLPRNEYYEAVVPVEIGDVEVIDARVARAMAGEPIEEATAYRAALARLRPPAEIVRLLTGRA